MAKTFANKIMAIKAIRDTGLPVLVKDTNQHGQECFRWQTGIGLLEAKEIVEAIMALANADASKFVSLQIENQNLKTELDNMTKAYSALRSGIYGALDEASEFIRS